MLNKQRYFFRRSSKANVAVEFALVTSLFLLPLFLGSADFISILAAQAQANTALQALFYFALSNSGNAANATDTGDVITAINAATVFKLSLATPTTQTLCYTTGSLAPTFAAPANGSTSCTSSQTTQTFVTYTVTTKVVLPVPLPGLNSPYTATATGSIETQ